MNRAWQQVLNSITAAGPLKFSGHKNKPVGIKEAKFLIRYKSLISSASLDHNDLLVMMGEAGIVIVTINKVCK